MLKAQILKVSLYHYDLTTFYESVLSSKIRTNGVCSVRFYRFGICLQQLVTTHCIHTICRFWAELESLLSWVKSCCFWAKNQNKSHVSQTFTDSDQSTRINFQKNLLRFVLTFKSNLSEESLFFLDIKEVIKKCCHK